MEYWWEREVSESGTWGGIGTYSGGRGSPDSLHRHFRCYRC